MLNFLWIADPATTHENDYIERYLQNVTEPIPFMKGLKYGVGFHEILKDYDFKKCVVILNWGKGKLTARMVNMQINTDVFKCPVCKEKQKQILVSHPPAVTVTVGLFDLYMRTEFILNVRTL